MLPACEPPGVFVPDPLPRDPPPTLGECYAVTGDFCARCRSACDSVVIYEGICQLEDCLDELPESPCRWPDSCLGALDIPWSQCE